MRIRHCCGCGHLQGCHPFLKDLTLLLFLGHGCCELLLLLEKLLQKFLLARTLLLQQFAQLRHLVVDAIVLRAPPRGRASHWWCRCRGAVCARRAPRVRRANVTRRFQKAPAVHLLECKVSRNTM